MCFFRTITAITVAVIFTSNTVYATAPQLRGKLAKGATGAYVVEQVGTDVSSPYFNFTTRGPDGYVTKDRNCTSALWYLAKEAKCRDLEGDFIAFSTNWGTTLFVNTFGQLFMLAPIVTGGAPVYRTASFDSRNYESAVNSAMAKIDAATISARYGEVIKKIEETVKEHNRWAKENFEQIRQKHKAAQEQNRRKLPIETVVEDQTGFWRSKDLPKISLVDNHLPIRTSEISFDFRGVDATAPDSFLAVLSGIEGKLNATVARGKTKALAEAAAYDDELRELSSVFNLPHQLSYKVDGFTINVKAPSKVVMTAATAGINVIYTIEGKDWLDVFPGYSNYDENIKIELVGDKIRLLNKTSNYLTVSSIAAYYNNEVNNFESELELPPKTYKEVPASYVIGSDAIRGQASYYNVNKSKAALSNFTFGMAAKYRVVDKNQEKSLYKLNKYNLAKVITGRI